MATFCRKIYDDGRFLTRTQRVDGEQPFDRRLLIAGNHELFFQDAWKRDRLLRMMEDAGVTYLEDSGANIGGLQIWGTPWQPSCGGMAFGLESEAERAAKWALVPEDTDLLLVHGPPYGVRDRNDRWLASPGHQGCRALTKRVRELPRLAAIVCGHIHEGAGLEVAFGDILVVNAAVAGARHKVARGAVVVDLDRDADGRWSARQQSR